MSKRRTKKYRDTPERKMYREGGLTSRHIELAILGSAVLSKEEQLLRLSIVKPAFEAVSRGEYTKDQGKEVLTVHNVIVALAARPGNLKGDVQEFLRISSETLAGIAKRHYQEGDHALTIDEHEVLWALYDLFVEVLASVPVRDIERAEHTVNHRVTHMQNVRNLDEFKKAS